jgi:hypothetical protein
MSPRGGSLFRAEIPNLIRSPLFEIAGMPVHLDHVARLIVNANHSIL